MTILPGEMDKIPLRSRARNRTNAHVGTNSAVNGVALRLSMTHSQFNWFWGRATGGVVLQRQQVERIGVRGVQ
jgi:hypothetical protein